MLKKRVRKRKFPQFVNIIVIKIESITHNNTVSKMLTFHTEVLVCKKLNRLAVVLKKMHKRVVKQMHVGVAKRTPTVAPTNSF